MGRHGCLFRMGLAVVTLIGSAGFYYLLLSVWRPVSEGQLFVALFVFLTITISLPSMIVYRISAKKRLQANRAALLRAAMICPTCGYNCRKTPERCPECGTKLNLSATGT